MFAPELVPPASETARRVTPSAECGDCIVRSPDEQPVSSIRDMAFVASEPIPLERMHVIPTLQLAGGASVIAANEFDDLLERREISMASI